MTAAEVRRDEKIVANYVALARKMGNCTRTDWRGRNGGVIEHRAKTLTEGHNAPKPAPQEPAAAAAAAADADVDPAVASASVVLASWRGEASKTPPSLPTPPAAPGAVPPR